MRDFVAKLVLRLLFLQCLSSALARGQGQVYLSSNFDLTQAFYGMSTGEALQSASTLSSVTSFAYACESTGSTTVLSSLSNPCVSAMEVNTTALYPEQGRYVVGETTRSVYSFDESTRKTCEQLSELEPDMCAVLFSGLGGYNGDTYVYFINFAQGCPAAVLCNVTWRFTSPTGEQVGDVLSQSTPTIMNPFNASVLALRELYGVPDVYKGNEDMVQLVSINPTYTVATNTDAVEMYLNALNIDHRRVEMAFGRTNNISACLVNGSISDTVCPETTLDVSSIQGVAPLARTMFLPINGDEIKNGDAEAALSLMKDIREMDPKPDIVSWSWGVDSPSKMFFEKIDELEEALKGLAMMNITILVGSGDLGAAGLQFDNGTVGCVPKRDGGLSDGGWPSSSPWVTSVGGTDVLATVPNDSKIENTVDQNAVMTSELSNTGDTSGGGFSSKKLQYKSEDYAWQKKAVETFLSQNGPENHPSFPTVENSPSYNPSGRGFPDISAYGSNMPLIDSTSTKSDSSITQVAGTSLSAPILAALFSLANQALVEQGYDKIGYANPMLYWMGENCSQAFTDVAFGTNRASRDGVECDVGYPSTEGWDPATGLGTINFVPFVECAKAYQDSQRSVQVSVSPSPQGGASYYYYNLWAGMIIFLWWISPFSP